MSSTVRISPNMQTLVIKINSRSMSFQLSMDLKNGSSLASGVVGSKESVATLVNRSS